MAMNEDPDLLDLFQEEEDEPPPPPVVDLPTVDGLPARQEYPDWSAATTKVVSGPLGTATFPGRRFATRQQARAYWKQRAGRIFEDHYIPGRYAFRVRRDA